MFHSKQLRQAVTAIVCVAVCMQQAVFAAGNSNIIYVDGVKVHRDIKNLTLDEHGQFNGAIVDSSGKPVVGADVVIGREMQPVALLKTDADGRYTTNELKPGIYQVASFAGVQTFRVYQNGQQPKDAVAGAIAVMDDQTLRGQSCSSCDSPGCDGCGSGSGSKGGCGTLCGLLKNPLVWGVVIAAAIVLPIVLSDDDDDAS